MITFTVDGHPATKGSVRAVVRGRTKTGAPKAITIPMSKRLPAWHEAVGWAAKGAMQGRAPLVGPVEVVVYFFMPRPKKPAHPWPRGDADKLLRALLDGLSGIAFGDDDQVVRATAHKAFAGPMADVGALVHVKAYVLDAAEEQAAYGTNRRSEKP